MELAIDHPGGVSTIGAAAAELYFFLNAEFPKKRIRICSLLSPILTSDSTKPTPKRTALGEDFINSMLSSLVAGSRHHIQ